MKKQTNEEFMNELKIKNPDIELLSEYLNSRTKVLVRGVSCGHEWTTRPYDLLQGHGCPKCRYISNSKRSSRTHEQFLTELRSINPNIEV